MSNGAIAISNGYPIRMHVRASVIYCDLNLDGDHGPAAPQQLRRSRPVEPYPNTAGMCTTSPASHSTSGTPLQLVRTTSHSAAALRARAAADHDAVCARVARVRRGRNDAMILWCADEVREGAASLS